MEYVQAGGKKRPFRISYKAVKELTQREAEDPDLPTRNQGIDYAELQFFIGFKYGAIAEKSEVDFDQSDVENWLDEDFSLVTALTELSEKSLATKEAGKKKGG